MNKEQQNASYPLSKEPHNHASEAEKAACRVCNPVELPSSNPLVATLREVLRADPSRDSRNIRLALDDAIDEIERLTAERTTLAEAHGSYIELYAKTCIERDQQEVELEHRQAKIMRLTRERDFWKERNTIEVRVAGQLDAENDRLRAALERIARREDEARAAVKYGYHNTTFAIDLAAQAREALRGADETSDV